MSHMRRNRAGEVTALAWAAFLAFGLGFAPAAEITFEMAVAPDVEATPMTRFGDGFGDVAAGDFPPAGLQGDGTARFLDSGSNGKDAFLITGLGATFTVDLRVMSHAFVQPPSGNDRRSMGVHDGSNGRGILVEPDGLRFVNGSGVAVGTALLDLTSLRQVRIVLAGGSVYVYDLETDLDGGPGFDWQLVAGPIGLGGSGSGGEIGGLGGGLHINSLDVINGSSVQYSDFTLDWLRIDTGVDRGATGPIIPQGPLPDCLTEVLPVFSQSVTAFQNEAATPDHITYTVGNPGEMDINWSVQEVDATGNPADYSWFGLSGSGGSILAGQNAAVDVNAFDSSVEGAFTGYILFTDSCGEQGCVEEGFAYPAGGLNGNDGWAGTATTEIAVDAVDSAETVKIIGGAGALDAVRTVSCGSSLANISVIMKIRAGSGDSTLWYLHINDSSGRNMAQFYGTGTSVAGRIASAAGEDRVTEQKLLSGPETWDEVEVRIFPASKKAAFYFNGALMARSDGNPAFDADGILDYSQTGAGDMVGQLRFERLDRGDLPNDFLHVDDLTVSYGPDSMRRIDLQVIGCSLHIEEPQRRTVGPCGETSVTQEVFTIRNNGAFDWTGFMANEFSDDDDWLTLSYESHPVARGETAMVTALIDWSAVPSIDPGDDQVGLIRFSVTCDGGATFIHDTPPDTIVAVEDFQRIVMYDGDVTPTAPDSGGPGISFMLLDDGGIDQGQVVTDPDAVDGLAYRLVDVAGFKTKWLTNTNPAIAIHEGSGATIVARIKTASAAGTIGSNLMIFDDEVSSSFYWGGANGIIREVDRAEQSSVAGGDGDYHIVRLTAQNAGGANGIVIRAYLDEAAVPMFEMFNAEPIGSAAGIDALGFGTGSTPGEQDIYFDCVYGTNAGAFAPGEEEACIGRSLICDPTCNLPRADIDGDQDVDMTDFAELQRCITTANPFPTVLPPTCKCFDRNNDDRITSADVTSFIFCETGPGVIWAATADCPN